MTLPILAHFCRHYLQASRSLQIAVLLSIWLAAELVVHETGLPLPAGLVGMVLVLVMLASRRLSLSSLQRGANWFVADMLLFFIPAVPAVLDHREFLGWLGVKILVVILMGTVAVMTTTALTVDLCYRWTTRRG
jgi:holin-like protein